MLTLNRIDWMEKCNVWQKSQRRVWKAVNGGSIGARVLGTGTEIRFACIDVWKEIWPPEVLRYHHLVLKAGSNVANGAFRTGPVGLPVVVRRCRLRWLKLIRTGITSGFGPIVA